MTSIFSLAHSMQNTPGVYAVLLGSGVSRSASIPTGWEVTLDLIGRIAAMSGADMGGDPAAWYETTYGKAPGYSDLLDLLAKTPAERRSIMHRFFEPTDAEREDGLKLPTKAHRAIAELVRMGYIKVIVTTNFDRLMELALQDVGITPTVISTADATRGASPLVHQKCVVLKLHGDYLDDRTKNTEDELAQYDPAMDSYLDRVLDEFGLILCGWSGEWDLALRSAIERCPSRRYSMYWASRGKLGNKAQKLLNLRGGLLVQTDGADEFFTELQGMVEGLEDARSVNPLQIGVQVALAKKYVASSAYRVRLHDLLTGETARLRGEFENAMPVNARNVDDATIASRFKTYDKLTEGLRAMLFHASRWAKTDSHASIYAAIQNLTTGVSENGMNVWLSMRKYPCSSALYAAAMGAVDGENWSLFAHLCDAQFKHHGRVKNALEALGAENVVDERVAKVLANRYTPISDHFLSMLGPLFDSADVEADYERFEVLLALQFLADAKEEDQRYTLRGRFVWNHHAQAISRVRDEIVRNDVSWKPFKAGLFGGSPEEAFALISQLEKNVAALGRYYH
jgi:hypothetical protein